MDPNLSKILEAEARNVQAGNVDRALAQAKDYLNYTHGYNYIASSREFREFRRHVRGLVSSSNA